MPIMKYYWKKSIVDKSKDEIIARCYKTESGYKFEIGSAFDGVHPISGLRRFTATRESYCESERDIKFEEKMLKKQYTDIYTTEETYR